MESTPQEIKELIAKEYFDHINKGGKDCDWPGWNLYRIQDYMDMNDDMLILDDMAEIPIIENESGELVDQEGNRHEWQDIVDGYMQNNAPVMFKSWIRKV